MLRMGSEALDHGYGHSMLMASSMGQPLYTQMGYQVIGDTFYLGYAGY